MPTYLKRTLFAVLAMTASTFASAEEQSQCNRECIIQQVNDYVAALAANAPSQVQHLRVVKSTQNDKLMPIGEGIWQTITDQGGYQQVFVDSNLNSAVFFGAFSEGEEPLLLAIRFAFDGGKITELEHLVSRPDERNRLIRRHQLTAPNPVYEKVLAPEERSSREDLVAAADGYFDSIAENVSKVDMSPYCNRRENGVFLLRNENPETEACPIRFEVFNYITDVRDRRVAVVDEERGLVLAWAFFDIPGTVEVSPGPFGPSDLQTEGEPRVDSRKIPRSLYIAELFRVVDGQIQDIEAIMYNLDLGSTVPW